MPLASEPRRGSAKIGCIAVIVTVLVAMLLAFIAGFLVYQDIRNDNRHEFEKLMKRLDENAADLAEADWFIRFYEEELGKGLDVAARLRDARKFKVELEQERRQVGEKARSIWPR